MQNSNIDKWMAPQWHPDFGDPKVELEMLRAAARELMTRDETFAVELDCFEEGYMKLKLIRGGSAVADIYIVTPGDKRLWGVFMHGPSGDESYHEDVASCVEAVLRGK